MKKTKETHIRRTRAGGKTGGISAKALILPATALLALLHVFIIVATIVINSDSKAMATTMRNYSEYINEATSLLAGSSVLSETSSTYVLMNANGEDESVSVGPLIAYADEFRIDRRGDQVYERLKKHDLGDEVMNVFALAVNSANVMIAGQAHAIALVMAISPVVSVPEDRISVIPKYSLTAEEESMNDKEKQSAAMDILFGKEYSENKQSVSVNVTRTVNALKEESELKSAALMQKISRMRVCLWLNTGCIIIIMILTFGVVVFQLVLPLTDYAKRIEGANFLKTESGLYEMRVLASSYNELLARQEGLGNALRSAAETDALTGLPNRYAFNEYLSVTNESGYSVALFLFDLNYLKHTNDTKGHLAGDELIRSASKCIVESFGTDDGKNCFRFGGDEFAAFVKNCDETKLNSLISRFEELQKSYGVSIAFGYAYTEDISNTTYEKLFGKADKDMYARKTEMKRSRS